MLNDELSEIQRITPDVKGAEALLSMKWLDSVTKTNAYSYYAVYSILLSYFMFDALTQMSVLSFASALLLGLFIWSYVEYAVHRYVFHFNAYKQTSKLLTFIFHGIHHAYPKDVSRSITPLVFTLPTAAVFLVIFKLAFTIYSVSVFAGFILGYLLYTIIHDASHHFSMNYPYLKQLKKNHMRHHYFDNESNFGVSSPLWDILLRTYVKNKTVQ